MFARLSVYIGIVLVLTIIASLAVSDEPVADGGLSPLWLGIGLIAVGLFFVIRRRRW